MCHRLTPITSIGINDYVCNSTFIVIVSLLHTCMSNIYYHARSTKYFEYVLVNFLKANIIMLTCTVYLPLDFSIQAFVPQTVPNTTCSFN